MSRIWQQAIRLIPINIRPIIGVKKIAHTKAVSDFSSAYCMLFNATRDLQYEKKAKDQLNFLESISIHTPNGLGWGLRFPFATRFVKADADQPNIFQTINAIHSFLDGHVAFGGSHYLDIAKKGFLFLKNDLGFAERGDAIYWKYWKGLDVEIYNVSGLMIGLCARMWHLCAEQEYLVFSQKLYKYIGQAQNEDGSWHYSADPKGRFIDGFHTGYILEGIIKGIIYGAIRKDEILDKGVNFYLANFFTEDGIPRYFHHSTFPIDGQNAAQALQTLNFIFNVNFAEKERLEACLGQIDKLLWNKKGYYNYKKTKILTYSTPMHRWVTGPMFLALVYIRYS